MQTVKCPVCGEELQDGICKNCGYVRIVYPDMVPDEIKKFEEDRISVLSKCLEEKTELKEQSAESAKNSQDQSEELQKDLDDAVAEARDLGRRLERNEKTLDNVKKELNDQIQLVSQFKQRVAVLESKLASAESDKAEEIADLKEQLDEALTHRQEARGLLVVERYRDRRMQQLEKRAVYAICAGDNSYGSNRPEGVRFMIVPNSNGRMVLVPGSAEIISLITGRVVGPNGDYIQRDSSFQIPARNMKISFRLFDR